MPDSTSSSPLVTASELDTDDDGDLVNGLPYPPSPIEMSINRPTSPPTTRFPPDTSRTADFFSTVRLRRASTQKKDSFGMDPFSSHPTASSTFAPYDTPRSVTADLPPQRASSLFVAASDALGRKFSRRRTTVPRQQTVSSILPDVIEISASRREEDDAAERERLRDQAAQAMGLGSFMIASSTTHSSTDDDDDGGDAEDDDYDTNATHDTDTASSRTPAPPLLSPTSRIGAGSSPNIAARSPHGSMLSVSTATRFRSGSLVATHTRTPSAPLLPIPSFPATLASLAPFQQAAASLPKYYPPSSLRIFALSRNWKSRYVLLSTPKDLLTKNSAPAVSYLHLFKPEEDQELERLEINEDSVVFISEEEVVGGRKSVIKVGGVDVGALKKELNHEEAGRSMWFLQITDQAEAQKWITKIKNAVLGQRTVRAGLGIPKSMGGIEPRGDMDVMLSMRKQGIVTSPAGPNLNSPAGSLKPTTLKPPPSLTSPLRSPAYASSITSHRSQAIPIAAPVPRIAASSPMSRPASSLSHQGLSMSRPGSTMSRAGSIMSRPPSTMSRPGSTIMSPVSAVMSPASVARFPSPAPKPPGSVPKSSGSVPKVSTSVPKLSTPVPKHAHHQTQTIPTNAKVAPPSSSGPVSTLRNLFSGSTRSRSGSVKSDREVGGESFPSSGFLHKFRGNGTPTPTAANHTSHANIIALGTPNGGLVSKASSVRSSTPLQPPPAPQQQQQMDSTPKATAYRPNIAFIPSSTHPDFPLERPIIGHAHDDGSSVVDDPSLAVSRDKEHMSSRVLSLNGSGGPLVNGSAKPPNNNNNGPLVNGVYGGTGLVFNNNGPSLQPPPRKRWASLAAPKGDTLKNGTVNGRRNSGVEEQQPRSPTSVSSFLFGGARASLDGNRRVSLDGNGVRTSFDGNTPFNARTLFDANGGRTSFDGNRRSLDGNGRVSLDGNRRTSLDGRVRSSSEASGDLERANSTSAVGAKRNSSYAKRWSGRGLPHRLTPPSGPPPTIPMQSGSLWEHPYNDEENQPHSHPSPAGSRNSNSGSNGSQHSVLSSLPAFSKRASASSAYSFSSSGTGGNHSISNGSGSASASNDGRSNSFGSNSHLVPRASPSHRVSVPPPPRPAPTFAPPPAPDHDSGAPSSDPTPPPATKSSFRNSVVQHKFRLSSAPKPPPSSVLPPRPDDTTTTTTHTQPTNDNDDRTFKPFHRRSSSANAHPLVQILDSIPASPASSPHGSPTPASGSVPPFPEPRGPLPPTPPPIVFSPTPYYNLNTDNYTPPPSPRMHASFAKQQRPRIRSLPYPTSTPPPLPPSTALSPSLTLSARNRDQHRLSLSPPPSPAGVSRFGNDLSFLHMHTPPMPSLPPPSALLSLHPPAAEVEYGESTALSPPPRRGSTSRAVVVVAESEREKEREYEPAPLPESPVAARLAEETIYEDRVYEDKVYEEKVFENESVPRLMSLSRPGSVISLGIVSV